MTEKPIPWPHSEEGRARLIGRMLEREGATCLADLGSREPYIVGKYYLDEPIKYDGRYFRDVKLQFSHCEDFEGDDPPENTWEDLRSDAIVEARYWRLWSGLRPK